MKIKTTAIIEIIYMLSKKYAMLLDGAKYYFLNYMNIRGVLYICTYKLTIHFEPLFVYDYIIHYC